jgi:hypothetical protein
MAVYYGCVERLGVREGDVTIGSRSFAVERTIGRGLFKVPALAASNSEWQRTPALVACATQGQLSALTGLWQASGPG